MAEIPPEQAGRTDAAFLQSLVGMAYIDSAGRCVRVNPALARIFERPADALVGLPFNSLFLNQTSTTAPFQAARGDGAASSIRRWQRGDGTVGSAQISIEPAAEGTGTPTLSLAVIIDLTSLMRQLAEQRVQAEESARETNERFQLAFHASPVAIVISRPGDGVYVDVNQAALTMFGYTREEVVGRSALTLNLWADPADRDDVITTLAAEGQVNRREIRLRHKNGSPVLCLVSVRLVSVKGVRHLLFVSEDVTQQRMMEAQLLQSQKLEAVGRLAGGIAHDFNNLLTIILGGAQEVLNATRDRADFRVPALAIAEAAERATELTRGLLTLSRKHAVQPDILDVNDVINGLSRILTRTLGENFEFRIKQGEDVALVRIDRGQLEQVILNMVINARDAMPRGGSLSIETVPVPAGERTGLDGAATLVRITDTGVGMSPEVMAHVFEPFFTTKGTDRGTGLGLSTAFAIIRQAGGMIRVDSKPSRGSTFEILLPAAGGSKEEASRRPIAGGQVGGTETILLVEDEPSVRALCARLLGCAGYRILEAADGPRALALARAPEGHDIALLLTDMVMPGMNGVELAAEVRRLSPSTKVLLMSGYTDAELKLPAKAAAFAFLQKPFVGDTLLQAVRTLLDGPSVSA